MFFLKVFHAQVCHSSMLLPTNCMRDNKVFNHFKRKALSHFYFFNQSQLTTWSKSQHRMRTHIFCLQIKCSLILFFMTFFPLIVIVTYMYKCIDTACWVCLVILVFDFRTDQLVLDSQLRGSSLRKIISHSQHSLVACRSLLRIVPNKISLFHVGIGIVLIGIILLVSYFLVF